MNKANNSKTLRKNERCSTIAIKAYKEQLPYGENELISSIKLISPNEMQILAIYHGKSETAHWHILARPSVKNERLRPSAIMKKLNIEFRDGIDDFLWENHGVETTGNFTYYANHLLHNGEYTINDFVSNISYTIIDNILNHGFTKRTTITEKTIDEYNKIAIDAGYNLENMYQLMESLNIQYSDFKRRDIIEDAYIKGVRKRMNEHKPIARLCLLIKPANEREIHKIFCAAEKALSDKHTMVIDYKQPMNIYPETQAIITNQFKKYELTSPYIYQLTAKKYIWAGTFLIIVANNSNRKENVFTCSIKDNKLICEDIPDRDFEKSEAEQIKINFLDFKEKFNNALVEYDKQQILIKEFWDNANLNAD